MSNGEHEEVEWSDDDESRTSFRDRLRALGASASLRADSLEDRYLAILRFSLLAVATLLLAGAAILALLGLSKQMRSSDIEAEGVVVSASDIAPATPEEIGPEEEVENAEGMELEKDLRDETLRIYASHFAKYEREGDAVTDDQVIEAVWPEGRREAFDYAADFQILDAGGNPIVGATAIAGNALKTVAESSTEAGFVDALDGYKAAEKVRICRSESRTRKRTVSYWNDYSRSCPGWYYSPVGCSDTRTVDEPYSVRVCDMQFPDDLATPREAMGNALDRYLFFAAATSESNSLDAENRAAEINESKLRGRTNMSDGFKLFLGFLGLMLLYLFIVFERHHRHLARMVPPADPRSE